MSSSRGFENGPAGMGAETTDPCNLGFAALFLVSGALEVGDSTEHPNREPGIFGDPLGLNHYNEELRLEEINNSRFAMCAAIGIISADHYIGKDATEQFGLAATGTMEGQQALGGFHFRVDPLVHVQSSAVTRRACDVPTKLGTMEPI